MKLDYDSEEFDSFPKRQLVFALMALFLAIVFALLSACAPTPTWRDVPSGPDPQAVEHNRRVCAEKGMTFDIRLWGCAP